VPAGQFADEPLRGEIQLFCSRNEVAEVAKLPFIDNPDYQCVGNLSLFGTARSLRSALRA